MTITQVRAVARLARRSAWRHPWRTGLIASLIGVAVTIAVLVAIAMRTTTPTSEQRVAAEFGTASLSIELNGYSDEAAAWLANEIGDAVPSGDVAILDTVYHAIGEAIATDLGSPLVEGMFYVLDGRPPGEGEVAVSWDIARRSGLQVGDVHEVPGFDAPLTVSAIVVVSADSFRRATFLTPKALEVLADDAAATGASTYRRVQWLVGGSVGSEALATRIESDWNQTVHTFSEPASDGSYRPIRSDLNIAEPAKLMEWGAFEYQDITQKPTTISTLIAALLLAEIALLAAAAYATGIRRRLREIGLISTQGATTGQIRAVVVGEALVTGSIGAVSGAALALALALVAQPIVQRLWNPLITQVRVAAVDLIVPVLIALAAAAFAAWLPARTASRVPVLTALQGRMPSRQHPRWLAPVSLVSIAAGLFLVVVARDSRANASSIQATIGVFLVIGGAALIGVPLATGAGRVAHLLPVTGRLVARDSARQSLRAAAAITALMVVLTGTVAAATAMQTNNTVRAVTYGLSQGDARFVLASGDHVVGPAGPESPEMRELSDEQVQQVSEILTSAASFEIAMLPGTAVLSEFAEYARDTAELGEGYCLDDPTGQRCVDVNNLHLNPGVADPAMLDAMGLPEARSVLESGVAVVLGNRQGDVEVTYGSETLPAKMVPAAVAPGGGLRLLVPESWAIERGLLDETRRAVLFVNDVSLTGEQRHQIYMLDFQAGPGLDGTGVTDTQTTALLLGAAFVATVIVIAIVTALSTTESDRDIGVIVAIGATPAFRRRFLGRQSAFHTASAALIAIPIGMLLMQVIDGHQFRWGPLGIWTGGIAVPWIAIGTLLVVLPLVVGFGTALIVRSLPARPPRRVG